VASDAGVRHEPVLLAEVVGGLGLRGGGVYVDGTAGSGGHCEAILAAAGPSTRLIAIDRDGAALERVERRLKGRGWVYDLVQGDFAHMREIVAGFGLAGVDGIVLDLGVSSEQLEEAARGFSFRKDGPLDMRMDPRSGMTAADLVNELTEQELSGIFVEFGEERFARAIARAIVKSRIERIETTGQLAAIVEGVKRRRGRIHPATKVFQALRIAVNRELESLRAGLDAGLSMLNVGGRMAVISFHSLEDREVKKVFRAHVGTWESLAGGGERWHGALPVARFVEKRAIRPRQAEVDTNPRARSAKLRIVECAGTVPPVER